MISVSDHDGFAVLEMRHGKVNAMDIEFCRALIQHLDEQSSSDHRGIVIIGFDRIFSAGVDLVRVIEEDESYLREFLPTLVEMFRKVFLFPKPAVAAVNGHAVAGGCVVACACDYRVISKRARIGVPELRVGVPFPAEGLEIMRSVASENSFRQMINTGATFTGEQAVDAGLAEQSVPKEEVLNVALEMLAEFASVPAEVFRLTKKHQRMPAVDRIERGISLYGDEIYRLWFSPETREHVKQYVESRLKSNVQ